MFDWLRRKSEPPNAAVIEMPRLAAAPGTGVSFDPNLITRFKGHHEVLARSFTKLRSAATQRQYAELASSMTTFRRVLTSHLLEENIRLYTYLTHCLRPDPASYELVREMQSEMNVIGKNVNAFITHYCEFGVNDNNHAKFIEELKGIGEALTDRIVREESTLYTLYMPPDAYNGY